MADIITQVQQALAEGDPALADGLCRAGLDGDEENGALWAALAAVAGKIGANQHAIRYFARAARLSPGDQNLVDSFDRAVAAAAGIRQQRLDDPIPEQGVLLIREIGGQFWTEIFHVLTAALIAEETDRIPVVHWGPRGPFPEAAGEDSFGAILVPPARRRAADLRLDPASVFPTSWAQLGARDAPPETGPRVHLPALLFRDEEIVVSDSWGWPIEVMSWTAADESVAADQIVATLRRLFRTYIIPRPEILQATDRTWTELGADPPMLAVHVPAAGDSTAAADLEAQDATCQAHIDVLISSYPEIRILMISESADILALYRKRFGGRVLSMPAATPSGAAGQAMIGALLASRCDHFVSNGVSNIAMAVYCMKDWGDDMARLIGPNPYLHRPGAVQAPTPTPVSGKIKLSRRGG